MRPKEGFVQCNIYRKGTCLRRGMINTGPCPHAYPHLWDSRRACDTVTCEGGSPAFQQRSYCVKVKYTEEEAERLRNALRLMFMVETGREAEV